MELSIVIPAHNEAGSIEKTVQYIEAALTIENISHEIIVVADHCTDETPLIVQRMAAASPSIRLVINHDKPGFGMAVRAGLNAYGGKLVCIVMADGSDSPEDIVAYYNLLKNPQIDCAFGSRFMRGSVVRDYPSHKLILNRLVNTFIRVCFSIRYNDVTNAFKMYRAEVIDVVQPLISPHFNLTVEIPLKAVIRGCTFEVIPISWRQRKSGVSKLKIKEMGSRYFFIIFYCLIEKWLSRGDYRRKAVSPPRDAKSK